MSKQIGVCDRSFMRLSYSTTVFSIIGKYLSVFNLKGNDSLSEEVMRNARNLHFKSIGIEIQQRLEFIFAANEKFGSTYNLPGKSTHSCEHESANFLENHSEHA